MASFPFTLLTDCFVDNMNLNFILLLWEIMDGLCLQDAGVRNQK